MNRDNIIRKLIRENNAIPQDLDKLTDDELMGLLDNEQAKCKEFTVYNNENDLIDDNF